MITTTKQMQQKQQRNAVSPLPVFFTGGVSADWTDDDSFPEKEDGYKYVN